MWFYHIKTKIVYFKMKKAQFVVHMNQSLFKNHLKLSL